MRNLFSLVLISVLGGTLTLGAYKMFIEKDNAPITTNNTQTTTVLPNYIPTKNTLTTTALTTEGTVSFVNAAEKTVNAVVHVKNISINSAQPTLQDFMMGRVPQKKQLGTGSGVIISPDGYIITNNHVIEGSTALSVTLNDNRTLEAEIIGTDSKTDIALLKVKSEGDLPFIAFGNSDTAKIGEWVLAVGNPFNLTSTVTAGIISAKSRDLSGNSRQSFIQTDAAVNPGNSGGALVNSNGELVGINTAISSQTGSYIGYAFAVPSNIAKKVVYDLMEFGNVQNGILGVTGGSLNSAYAEKLNVNETEGFYVDDVDPDSGAAEAGITSGDIIKKIDNIKINKFSDLRGYLDTKRPNDIVEILLLRNGSKQKVSVKLLKNNSFTMPMIGVIKNIKPKELKRLKLKNGVRIVRLANTHYAKYIMRDGVNAGSIITKINGKSVNSVDDVQNTLKNKPKDEPLRVEIINSNGQVMRYMF